LICNIIFKHIALPPSQMTTPIENYNHPANQLPLSNSALNQIKEIDLTMLGEKLNDWVLTPSGTRRVTLVSNPVISHE
jgi:hypothetical protein